MLQEFVRYRNIFKLYAQAKELPPDFGRLLSTFHPLLQKSADARLYTKQLEAAGLLPSLELVDGNKSHR